MKILITGAKGFIGKNLIVTLERLEGLEIYQFDIDTDPVLLDTYTKDCEFVFHLAGVNRPQNVEEIKDKLLQLDYINNELSNWKKIGRQNQKIRAYRKEQKNREA